MLKADKTEWELIPPVPDQLSEETLKQQMRPVWKGGQIYLVRVQAQTVAAALLPE